MMISAPLAEHIRRVIGRSRAFYRASEPGHFLIHAHAPVDAPAIPPLDSFDLDRQLATWLDHALAAARAEWRGRAGLDDDAIPSICPRFGIAEHTAWLGAEVRLQTDTCLPVPLLREPEDLYRLTLSGETPWYRRMKASYDYLRSRQDGTFVLSVRGAMMPMDIANALRGDVLFSDFLLNPEFAHCLIRFLTGGVDWYYRRLRSWADELDGGHVMFYHGSWMGPDVLGHVTNDAAMLCSRRIYEQFGFPYERELCGRYGQVLYHVHNEKLHFAPCVAQLPNLALFEVTNDPKKPPAAEDLPRVLAAVNSPRLILHAASDQVRQRIGELKQRNVFLNVTCRDRADAEDIVAFVRAASRPLTTAD